MRDPSTVRSLRMIRRPFLALLVLLIAACGERASDPPEVVAARIMVPPPGAPMAAGYFALKNPGREALQLVGVRSASFESVEMHETVEENGVSRMRALARVEVPAGGQVAFEPGGKHLMLMGPKLGDTPPAELPLTLELQSHDGEHTTLEARFTLEQAGGGHEHPH